MHDQKSPNRRRAALTLGLLAVSLAAPAVATETLRFEVLLNDRPIGEHSFRIAEQDGQTRVSSRANFEVDFLFLTAYRYRHQSQEVFRDGCLTEIDASTNDNGKRYEVAGSTTGDGFRVQHGDGETTANGCVKTFAYWDRAFLQQDRLLNSQTGELEPVAVREAGRDAVEVNGREVPATRYALSTDELTIDLWYNDDLGWVGLSSDTGNGRRLSYRRL